MIYTLILAKRPRSDFFMIYDFKPVKNSSSSNGQGHHDNQVGQEGKSAENKVGSFSKTSFDNLKQN